VADCSAWAETATLANAAATQRESFQFITIPVWVEAMRQRRATPAATRTGGSGTAGTRQSGRRRRAGKIGLKVYYRLKRIQYSRHPDARPAHRRRTDIDVQPVDFYGFPIFRIRPRRSFRMNSFRIFMSILDF
jgi:hypothetical protein